MSLRISGKVAGTSHSTSKDNTSKPSINCSTVIYYKTPLTSSYTYDEFGNDDHQYGSLDNIVISGVDDNETVYVAIAWEKLGRFGVGTEPMMHWFDIDPRNNMLEAYNYASVARTAYLISQGASLSPITTPYRIQNKSYLSYNDGTSATCLVSDFQETTSSIATAVLTLEQQLPFENAKMWNNAPMRITDWENGPYDDAISGTGVNYKADFNHAGWTFAPWDVLGTTQANTAYIMFWGPAYLIRNAIRGAIMYDHYTYRGDTIVEALRPYRQKFCLAMRTEADTETVYSDLCVAIDKRKKVKGTTTDPGDDPDDINPIKVASTEVTTLPNYETTWATKWDENVTYPNVSQIEYSYIVDRNAKAKNLAVVYKGKKITNLASASTVEVSATYGTNTADCIYDYATNKRYGTGQMFNHTRWTDNLSKFQSDCWDARARCDENVFSTLKDNGGSGCTLTHTVTGTAMSTVTVTAGGIAYFTPVVAMDTNGVGAAFTVTLNSDGTVLSVAVTSAGSGFAATDNIYLIETCGPGAGNNLTPKRYTLNALMQQDKNFPENLADMASSMHGKPYWYEGYLRLYQDKPRGYNAIINQTNAHSFAYASDSVESTTATVTTKFNNKLKEWTQDAISSEDFMPPKFDAVTGIIGRRINKDVIGFGIDTADEARRYGRMIIEDDRTAHQLLTCTTGALGMWTKPGDLCVVSNSIYDGTRWGGRIVSITGSQTVVIDNAFTFVTGKVYYLYFQYGMGTSANTARVFSGTITNPGTTTTSFNLSTTFAATIKDPNVNYTGLNAYENCPYIIAEAGKHVIYEVLTTQEKRNFEYELELRKYDGGKFGRVDLGYVSGFGYSASWPASFTEDSDD
jgi:hypothetical protein